MNLLVTIVGLVLCVGIVVGLVLIAEPPQEIMEELRRDEHDD